VRDYCSVGVPKALAQRIARCSYLYAALNVTAVAAEAECPIVVAARVYFALSAELEFEWLAARIGALPEDSVWQARARGDLRERLAALQRHLVLQALQTSKEREAPSIVQAWIASATGRLEQAQRLMAELHAVPTDLAALSVALRELERLIGANRSS
jgi:glutamate dehydrogenase